MYRRSPQIVAAMLGLVLFGGADWRQFRGTDATGVSRDASPAPTSWGPKENIAWQVELPGRGLSAPIVVGDRVIVTAGSGPNQDRLRVLCFSTKDGSVQWDRQFWSTGRTMAHPKTSIAASTPVSDGKRIFALYSTNDVVCLDLDGNLLWLRGLTHDYANVSNSLGMASSPTFADDTLIVQVENDSLESYAIGIDAASGVNRWRLTRPSSANWVSPIIVRADGKELVLLQSGPMLSAHEPRTGKELWTLKQGCSTMASSVAVGNRIFVPSNGMTALDVPAAGAQPKPAWSSNRLGPATPSPIVYEEKLYTVNNGILRCARTSDGELLWQLRLEGSDYSATPVAVGGHIYFFRENGLGLVVKPGEKEGKIVGKGQLEGDLLGTPAVSDGAIYVRTDKKLWKISRS